jgi:hypothetical protein
MPDEILRPDSSVNFMKSLGAVQKEPANDISLHAAQNEFKPTSISKPVGAEGQLKAAEEFPQPEAKGYVPDIKLQLKDDKELRDHLERQLSYERFIEDAEARIGSTTLPWEIRMAVRDAIFQFVDAPPGLGDNWGLQRLFNFLDSRQGSIKKLVASDNARNAAGLEIEPWRDTKLINRQNRTELRVALLDDGKTDEQAKIILDEMEKNARERAPLFIRELGDSREELQRTRKVFFLTWAWRNVASGNELGELYLQNKIQTLPTPKDFALMFQTPAYFMTSNEATSAGKKLPDYPADGNVKELLETLGRTENSPTGEVAEKETRLMYLVALSENPEIVVEWKHKTEQAEIFKLYREAGVSQAYLILKEKGIDYYDPDEEDKIKRVLNSLTGPKEQAIKDAWWKSLGFAGEDDGIKSVGDPEKWIPTMARRGDPPTGSKIYFEAGFNGAEFDRGVQIKEIDNVLNDLKKAWGKLSPLNNPTTADRKNAMMEIAKLTDYMRGLTTYSGRDRYENLVPIRLKNGSVDAQGDIITMFASLPLERELGIRKGATEIGCIWSKVQRAGDKEKVIGAPDATLKEYVNGDMLAFEQAKATADIFGFTAKWGYYARDYDPAKDSGKKGSPLAYVVDVEAWPYTSEFQNILAFPWYQSYKREAGGPPGSRGKFGPLMTDYLSAYSIPEFYDELEIDSNKRGKQMYDDADNPEYVIIDKSGKLGIGRADEGVVICDVNFSLLEHWERGESLSNAKLWDKVDEDPFRRFTLRSFFAEGKSALGPGGNSLLDTWKKREWKLEDLDNDKFWDDYKLARKVALRKELLGEVVWKDVAEPIDEKYKKMIVEAVNKIKNEKNYGKRLSLMRDAAGLYESWQADRLKEVYNYSDQMFWNGVASTEGVKSWNQGEPGTLERSRQERPSDVIKRIVLRAKRCTVNLIGSYSDSNYVQGIMKQVIS